MNNNTPIPRAYQAMVGNHNVITGKGPIYVHDDLSNEVMDLRPLVGWIQEMYSMGYDKHSPGRGLISAIGAAKEIYIGMLEAFAQDADEVMECGNVEMERLFMSLVVRVLGDCRLEQKKDLQVRDR